MANSFLPGLTPGYFLQQQRFNNSQNPTDYDPDNVVDPYQAIAAQQAYAKQLFAMQNPRLALPNQFGSAIGAALQGMMAGGQQAPVAGQQAQGAKTPAGQAIHQKYLELRQQGMDAGQALYTAADAGETSEFGDIGTKAADRARTWAVDKYKYDPNLKNKLATEAQFKGAENFVNQKTGEKTIAQPGTPKYNQLVESGDWLRQGDVPQIPIGERRNNIRGAMNAEEEYGPNGWAQVPGSRSPAPVQYAATLTGDDAKSAFASGPGGSAFLTNAAHDAAAKELGNRSAATKNAIDALDGLSEALSRSPNAVGKAGDYLEGFNNIASTVQSLANVAADKRDYSLSPKAAKNLAGLVDRTRNAGVDATKWNALITDAAYAIEATQGSTNTDPASRKSRIDQIKDDILADRSSDPRAILGVIEAQKNTLRSKLKTDFANTPGGISPPSWLGPAAPSTPQAAPAASVGGPMANWSAEKKARYQAWKAKHPNGQ